MGADFERREQAREVFADYLAQVALGAGRAFLELCHEHPGLEGELSDLHRKWQDKRPTLLPRADSVSGLIEKKYGSDDPEVSLEEESEASVEFADAAISKLEEHVGLSTRYRIKGEIARGGMGAILRVWDADLRRHLAMKVILGTSDSHAGDDTPEIDPDLVGRFLEEAQVTSQLNHPGVVPVHELGLDKDGRVYFTMRLVKGRELKEICPLAREGREDWSVPRALRALLKVCEAVSYAHDKGVIHRDLKPANVMVGKYGEVYVMDWGLAKVLGQDDRHDLRLAQAASVSLTGIATDRQDAKGSAVDSPLITMDGTVVGTPAYMAPEQARGDIENLDRRTDVYAVGAMLYQLLTGQPPYVAHGVRMSAHTILASVLGGPPKPVHEIVSDVPSELEAICERAMARDPGDRYADMGELSADLRAYLDRRVVLAYETGTWAETKKWVQRNKPLAAALVAVALSLVVGLATSLFFKSRSDESAALAVKERDNVLRLSASLKLEELKVEVDELWPVGSDQIERLLGWRERTQSLIDGLDPDEATDDPGHRNQLASLRARARTQTPTIQFTAQEDGWLHAQLEKLVLGIETFERDEGLVAGRPALSAWCMTKRLAFAEEQRDGFAPGGEYAVRWRQALPDIRAAYPELDLPVQVGLVPIGADPESELWEFWHQATGDEPQRDAERKLQLTEESGVVLVLLPGGKFWMGAQPSDPAGRNFDPQAEAFESPVHQVELSPFFLSKYELTQGQWKRMTGGEPSAIETALHPVENVHWLECKEWLWRMGLVLPSEAQWEYGARGDTDTPWSTGEERESLREHRAANLADQAAARVVPGPPWPAIEDWPELDDGTPYHAEVGTYAANLFGLHDVHGNVREWCLDGFVPRYPSELELDPVAPPASSNRRVCRGGSFMVSADKARSACRLSETPSFEKFTLGVRPARVVVRE